MAKESWKQLLSLQTPTRALSPEWINRKPQASNFDLDETELNNLYREYKRFIENKKLKIARLENSKSEVKKGDITWEGYASLFAAIAMVVYALAAEPASPIIFGALALISILLFFLYYFKRRRKIVLTKTENEEIDKKIRLVRDKDFERIDEYNALLKYVRALYDYQCWQQRRKPSYWTETRNEDLISALVSMYKTLGYTAQIIDEDYISLTYTAQNGRTCAVYISRRNILNGEDVNAFINEVKYEKLHLGTIFSPKGFSKEALELCTKHGIEILNAEGAASFAMTIESKFKNED